MSFLETKENYKELNKDEYDRRFHKAVCLRITHSPWKPCLRLLTTILYSNRDAFLGLADCEVEIETIDNDVERFKLNKLKPFYEKRDKYIDNIDDFWKVVLSQNTDFANYIRASDFKYVDNITKVVVKWLIWDENSNADINVRDFSITFHFKGIEHDFPEQSITKVFKMTKMQSNKDFDDDDEAGEDNETIGVEEVLTSEPVDIEWPQSYESINPSLIEDKRSPQGKKNYRQGMKSFFGWFKWTGKKPGKEFPHGEDLASLLCDDIYPYCVKYYTEAQRDLEDEYSDSEDDNSDEEPLDLPKPEGEDEDGESDKLASKKRRV